ncbi:hydroxymethylglutaryl-CoA lyase [Rhodoferax koreense]|uniref:Hydroxymethylglutaryl-CoA lyase n=1 Tax=Rhodoferax koreensis TaxID=1842727 RepID=A0A1P8K1C1_9BURK|nr:hydroxymethylglutaryl-CoA lyase [Rhodoferax koreense]APW39741.1 hydroxymethylglutaryl-CoA lyase [Rhodoferax koreense]
MSNPIHADAATGAAPRPRDVVLCECFARDGLQHEPAFIPTPQKAALIDRFAAIGFERVEATSYSNPSLVPQFQDASALLQQLPRRAGAYYKATCANPRAVERATADRQLGFGANEISFLVSASESHSQRNLKRSRAAQWDNVRQMRELAGDGFRIVGTVSVAFGCPFEGRVDPQQVVRDVEAFARLGVTMVALGDTTGMATPRAIHALVGQIAAEVPGVTLVAHFHDSRGTGLVNCLAAYEAGVRHFDAAFGGVGGHPATITYGGGYTGNVCTEDLVNLFEAQGVRTGIDLDSLLETAELCEKALNRPLLGHVTRTGLSPLIGHASAPETVR